MASTIIKSTGGAGSVTFGTDITFSTLIIESQEHSKNIETTTISDADGDVAAVGFYGPTEDLSLSGSTNGTPTVTLGTSISLTGAPTGTWVPVTYSESRSNNGFKKFSLACKRWPGTES